MYNLSKLSYHDLKLRKRVIEWILKEWPESSSEWLEKIEAEIEFRKSKLILIINEEYED